MPTFARLKKRQRMNIEDYNPAPRAEDKLFNKALASAVSRVLTVFDTTIEVASEIQAPQGNLKPDIRILFHGWKNNLS